MSQPDRRAAVVALLDERRSGDPGTSVGNVGVDIALRGSGNGPFLCRFGDFEWVVDEPARRGGLDSGANPLAYFLSGAATCLLSHFMLFAIEEDVAIEDLRLRAAVQYDRSLPGGHFTDIAFDVSLRSTVEAGRMEDLFRRAQDACYTHRALRTSVTLTTSVEYNGKPLVVLVA